MQDSKDHSVAVYVGEALAAYGFGRMHPFGPDRMSAFWQQMCHRGLDQQVSVRAPVQARDEDILLFHTPAYLDKVKRLSANPVGCLDQGDTPAFSGMYEATAAVVGSVLAALDEIIRGQCRQAFVPIAGLHHARRDAAAGFCVFNDCGVAIEALRRRYRIKRVAYVDIDAHHGDGVFYAFEEDPDLINVDFHEDGHFLYPGTGMAEETGRGVANGRKLNVPLPPETDDPAFFPLWETAEAFLNRFEPDFILFQCGADSLAGDPITHLNLSPDVHAHVATRLKHLAQRHSRGRLLALGGGGYNRDNLARAWTAVVAALLGGTR